MRYPKVSFGSRLLAALLDALVGSAPLVVLGIAFGVVFSLAIGASVSDGDAGRFGPGAWAAGLAMLVAAAWSLWYGFTKDGMGEGQSVGKRAMGLMVVHTPTDTPCTRGQSAVRALVWGGTNLVPGIGFLIEPLAAILDARGRRFGDRAADTQVVDAAEWRRRQALRDGYGAYGSLRDPAHDALLDPTLGVPMDRAMREALAEVEEVTRRGER